MPYEDMLYMIVPKNKEELIKTLKDHPEVKFASLVGVDFGGHDTDEKIPIEYFIDNIDDFIEKGVQTDGSSVVLPKIAELNNARVDLIPDMDVNWYVDYNYHHFSEDTGLPVGTIRIPSYLIHNEDQPVGSRVVLKNAVDTFTSEIMKLLKENPYIFQHVDIPSYEDIDEIVLTSATELEFWVKTPDDVADVEQLSTSQVLKEQYWKRTIGPVRTAMEQSILVLDKFGLEIEMGHKEVGGVKAKLGNSGGFDHVMEQLEIDWKYSTAIQASDNVFHVKDVIRDIFDMHGLEVTFMAKPIEGVAGNGEHTHMGVAVKLKNGEYRNLFAPKDMKEDFINPIGFGALMGLLKNYEIINPFVSSSNDALNRLKPGFEAPVCIVGSIGHTTETPSRNRTVLVGLVRDVTNPMATRFELRAPNPESNPYLVLASSYIAMLDGIKAALKAGKTSKELEKEFSKKPEEEGFYLEKGRAYRSERDVFDEYTQEERDEIFGKPPATVWENIVAFEKYPEKTSVLMQNKVLSKKIIESCKEAFISQWAQELYNRIIPNNMEIVRECVMLHTFEDRTDLDVVNWEKIKELRYYLMKDSLAKQSLFTRIKEALNEKDYSTASDLQIEMREKMQELTELFIEYKKNLF
ncbi:MAG: glutamine synthetase [Clostridia bacterium]|nr:glutamine synthetase [Clostridia bacterium]